MRYSIDPEGSSAKKLSSNAEEHKASKLEDDNRDKHNTRHRGLELWKALITSFLLQSFIMGTLESYGALFVPIKNAILNEDKNQNTKAALVGSLTTGCMMGFSPFSSILIEKHGSQMMALLGSYLVFMATLTTSFVRSYFLIVLLYGVMFGIGASLLFISSNVIISRYFEENSTLAYGILGMGNGLMNSIMPHVINYSVQSIELGGTLRLISLLLSCIMFFPLYWNTAETPHEEFIANRFLPTRISSARPNSAFKTPESRSHSLNMMRILRPSRFIKKKISEKPNLNSSNKPRVGSVSQASSQPRTVEETTTGTVTSTVLNVTNTSVDTLEGMTHFKKELESKDNLSQMLQRFSVCNSRVFSSKAYCTLLCAMPVAMLGYQVPNVHIINFSQKAFPGDNGQMLLTCLGGASAIGPFINAIILQRLPSKTSKYRIYQVMVIAYGMVVLTLSLASKYMHLLIICLVIGYLDGSFSSLTGPLAIDLVGNHDAGQAIGIFYGVIAPCVMVAPTMAGFICDLTDTYKPAFYTAGVCFIVGGLLLSISCNKRDEHHSYELELEIPQITEQIPGPFVRNLSSDQSDRSYENLAMEAMQSKPLFRR